MFYVSFYVPYRENKMNATTVGDLNGYSSLQSKKAPEEESVITLNASHSKEILYRAEMNSRVALANHRHNAAETCDKFMFEHYVKIFLLEQLLKSGFADRTKLFNKMKECDSAVFWEIFKEVGSWCVQINRGGSCSEFFKGRAVRITQPINAGNLHFEKGTLCLANMGACEIIEKNDEYLIQIVTKNNHCLTSAKVSGAMLEIAS